MLHAALPSLLIVPLPGNELCCGQKLLSAKNTSAVCGWLHGTARVSFGHGSLVFRCMLAPVRQSPTRSWESCRFPALGVDVASGVAGLVVAPADAARWLEPSHRTTAATITAHTAATAPIAHRRRVRRRGSGRSRWVRRLAGARPAA